MTYTWKILKKIPPLFSPWTNVAPYSLSEGMIDNNVGPERLAGTNNPTNADKWCLRLFWVKAFTSTHTNNVAYLTAL